MALLASLGYRVIASTGRGQEEEAYLKALGAADIIARKELSEAGAPIAKERFAGAIDSVGSHTARQCSRPNALWRMRRMLRAGAGAGFARQRRTLYLARDYACGHRFRHGAPIFAARGVGALGQGLGQETF